MVTYGDNFIIAFPVTVMFDRHSINRVKIKDLNRDQKDSKFV